MNNYDKERLVGFKLNNYPTSTEIQAAYCQLDNLDYCNNLTFLTVAERLCLHRRHASWDTETIATGAQHDIHTIDDLNDIFTNLSITRATVNAKLQTLVDHSFNVHHNDTLYSVSVHGFKKTEDSVLIARHLKHLISVSEQHSVPSVVKGVVCKDAANKIIDALREKFSLEHKS